MNYLTSIVDRFLKHYVIAKSKEKKKLSRRCIELLCIAKACSSHTIKIEKKKTTPEDADAYLIFTFFFNTKRGFELFHKLKK